MSCQTHQGDFNDQDIKDVKSRRNDESSEVENIIEVNEGADRSTSVVHVTSNQMFDVDAQVSDNTISSASLPSSHHQSHQQWHLYQQSHQLERMEGQGMRQNELREHNGSFTSREAVADEEIGTRRWQPEDRTKATCSDHAMVLSLIINVLSLILTIAVIILVVALMMSMAATSHLHSKLEATKFNAPFSPQYYTKGTYEYSREQNMKHSHKYKLSEKQTITSKFPFSPFPPLSSPVSPSIISSSVMFPSSDGTSPEEKKGDIIGEVNGKKEINEQKNVNEGRREGGLYEWEEENNSEGNENHDDVGDDVGWNSKLKQENQGKMRNGYNVITRVNEDGETEVSLREIDGTEKNDDVAKRDTKHLDDNRTNDDTRIRHTSLSVDDVITESGDALIDEDSYKKVDDALHDLISKVIHHGSIMRNRSSVDQGIVDEESIEEFGQIIALGPLLVLSSICGIAASQKHTGTTSVVIYWCFLTVTLVMSVYITSFHIDYDRIIGFESQNDSSGEEDYDEFSTKPTGNVDSAQVNSPASTRTTAIEAVSTLVMLIGSFQLFAAITVTFAKYQKKRVAIFEKDPNYNFYTFPGSNPREAFMNGIPIPLEVERSQSMVNIVANQ